MRLFLITLAIVCFMGNFHESRSQGIISGFVMDSVSQEALIGAHVQVPGSPVMTSTNQHGFFSIKTGILARLKVSYMGYGDKTLDIGGAGDTLLRIYLAPGRLLDEVQITRARRPEFNVSTLRVKEIESLPSLGAKPDVLKSMQFLPGIQGQNEGFSLLVVRGGNPGENLFLIDDIPLIHVNHLGGFLSVFNPDMINQVNVYKGVYPSRLGGKLSSVVDITQKEGDRSGLKGSFGIGLTDASFTLEGPTRLKNTSFMLTGRKTFFEAYSALVSSISDGGRFIVTYGFHDINGKFSWKPDPKNSLHLNLYQGDDYLNYWSKNKTDYLEEKARLGNTWGNWMASARWIRTATPRHQVTRSLSYSQYRLKLYQHHSAISPDEKVEIRKDYLSSIKDISLRWHGRYTVNNDWKIDYGLQSAVLLNLPSHSTRSNQVAEPPREVNRAIESALFLEHQFTFLKLLDARLGLRAVNFASSDYTGYSLEPRANLGIRLPGNHLLNASYTRVSQFSHLLFTETDFLNNEVWVPANKKIPPAFANQYTAGWSGTFLDGAWQAELSVYFKESRGLAMYHEGYSNLLGDTDWQSKVITGGKGEARGLEFYIRKNTGKWTGFASYTLSQTTRQYSAINEGITYPYEFDRPHTASIALSRKLSAKWSVSLAWVYQTGLPYTPVIGRQYIPELSSGVEPPPMYEAVIYGERNSARIRDYHRADVSFQYSTLTRKRGNPALWTFAVYNAYNRQNPNYYYLNTSTLPEIYYPFPGDDFKPLYLYQFSLFTIIPTVSYKVYFDWSKPREREKLPFGKRLERWFFFEN